jgi:ArsR family transcriptional regulator, arsenate/arsenite/antimonite-responsive transcriptional repressor
METVYEKNAMVFKAFCDEKRLRILELLQSGEKCTCVLMEKLDMPQSSLSYHMKILCESGIVKGREEGKWTHYHINETGRLKAMELLKELTSIHSSMEECGTCCAQ